MHENSAGNPVASRSISHKKAGNKSEQNHVHHRPDATITTPLNNPVRSNIQPHRPVYRQSLPSPTPSSQLPRISRPQTTSTSPTNRPIRRRQRLPESHSSRARIQTTRARAAVLSLPHGPVNLPMFMPVATQASLKGLTPHQLEMTGCRLCLNNTYHL
jgi:hypothetical protein